MPSTARSRKRLRAATASPAPRSSGTSEMKEISNKLDAITLSLLSTSQRLALLESQSTHPKKPTEEEEAEEVPTKKTSRKKEKNYVETGPPTARRKPVDRWDATLRDVDISGYEGLKNIVYKHFKILTNRAKATDALPPPLAPGECDRLETSFPSDANLPNLDCPPSAVFSSTHSLPIVRDKEIDEDYHAYLLSALARWQLPRITWDFSANPRDRVNEIMLGFVEKTLHIAARQGQYPGLETNSLPPPSKPLVIRKILVDHIKKTIEPREKQALKFENARELMREEDAMRKLRENTIEEYHKYLKRSDIAPELLAVFEQKTSCLIPHLRTVSENGCNFVDCVVPVWWSDELRQVMVEVERQTKLDVMVRRSRRSAQYRHSRRFISNESLAPELTKRVPQHLPTNFYNYQFLSRLPAPILEALSPAPAIDIYDFVHENKAGFDKVEAYHYGKFEEVERSKQRSIPAFRPFVVPNDYSGRSTASSDTDMGPRSHGEREGENQEEEEESAGNAEREIGTERDSEVWIDEE